jgi:hypothetical protein
MTAKEKAQELVGKFRMHDVMVTDLMGEELEGYEERHYKNCALIAVDEMSLELYEWGEVWMKRRINYWLEVKEEIEKL